MSANTAPPQNRYCAPLVRLPVQKQCAPNDPKSMHSKNTGAVGLCEVRPELIWKSVLSDFFAKFFKIFLRIIVFPHFIINLVIYNKLCNFGLPVYKNFLADV